jgi:hypothetical protein
MWDLNAEVLCTSPGIERLITKALWDTTKNCILLPPKGESQTCMHTGKIKQKLLNRNKYFLSPPSKAVTYVKYVKEWCFSPELLAVCT